MKRTPRPQGSTFLSLKYQQSQAIEDKQSIFKHLVSLYTLDGFRWNKKPTSIPELAQILKIPTQDIMAHISDLGTNMGNLATTQNIESTLKSIITLATSWAIQDRGLIAHQLDQLLVSQDGKYKPFITSEVNKALKLILESNKNLMDTYKTFFTSTQNTTNILNYIGKPDIQDQDYLTPDQALEIIQQKQLPESLPAGKPPSRTSEHGEMADELYQEYGIADLQDVGERRSGREALVPLGPDNQEVTEPSDDMVKVPERNEDGGFSRRAIDIEDTDELPEGS